METSINRTFAHSSILSHTLSLLINLIINFFSKGSCESYKQNTLA